jgi:hypothetical protein
MVLKAMLIGLLVIGAVAMLETDANAFRHCWPWACIEYSPEELDKVVAEVKKHAGSEVWSIGYIERVGSTTDYDRLSRKMAELREKLIQHGLEPGIIRELILAGYAPPMPAQRDQEIIVAWPYSGKDKR